jgi:hypothetical protein
MNMKCIKQNYNENLQRYVARHLHARKSGQFQTIFAHNLCFNYPNGSCESISDIKVSKAF